MRHDAFRVRAEAAGRPFHISVNIGLDPAIPMRSGLGTGPPWRDVDAERAQDVQRPDGVADAGGAGDPDNDPVRVLTVRRYGHGYAKSRLCGRLPREAT
jgi:hypothetical protein